MIHIIRDLTHLGDSTGGTSSTSPQSIPRPSGPLSPPLLIIIFVLLKWSLILAAAALSWIGLGLFTRGLVCLFNLGFYGHL